MASGWWGLVALGFAAASNVLVWYALRALNGIGIAAIMPITQSYIADYASAGDRGKWFGFVQLSSSVGGMLSMMIMSSLARQHFDFGGLGVVPGWRIGYTFIGVMSLVLASFVFMKLGDPKQQGGGLKHHGMWQRIMSEFTGLSRYLQVKSFLVIVGQGVVGCIPWSSMEFLLLWLQYNGISDVQAGICAATLNLCSGLGGVGGGAIGDYLAKLTPNHGRALTGQISVFLGIPFMYMILAGPTPTFTRAVILATCFGLTASWCSAGVNRPILAELVPSKDRAPIFAWQLMLEGTCSALMGAPIVGLLADNVFGYKAPMPGQDINDLPHDQYINNRQALTSSLLYMTLIPWTLCGLVYGLLHWTYPKDKQRANRGFDEVDPEVAGKHNVMTEF